MELFKAVDPSASIYDIKFEEELQTLPHTSYDWERLYCNFVRTGDIIGARRFWKKLAESGQFVTVGNVSKNDLAQTKYLAVSLIAVVTRVAINGGADELKSYQASDRFIQFLDTTDDATVIVAKLFEVAESMIQAVHDARELTQNNAYYNKCREYIAGHVGQKITISELAEHCQLTPNYLSCIFKKISGKTITDYILEQKIDLAKQLLLSKENKASEIASVLGFHSQSYFIERFKKQTGMTPRAWQISHSGDTGMELYPGI